MKCPAIMLSICTICLRYVDHSCNVREDFVAFLKLERVRANDITKAIVDTIEELGLSLDDIEY